MNKRISRGFVTAIAAAAFALAVQWTNKGQGLSAADMAAEKTGRMPASVKHCNDGDTCRIVTEPGHMWMNVRLAGVDAPERASRYKKSAGQPMGDDAMEFTNKNLAGKIVELEQVDLDAYNRPVVVIWNGGKNFNMTLVESGLAEAYRGPVKRIDQSEYIQAEGKAKAAKTGIWGLPENQQQSPSDYRKQLRLKKSSP